MSSLRNHARPASSLKERLLKFAEDARAAAQLIAPSREQGELLSRAQRAERLASAADQLSTHRLKLAALSLRTQRQRLRGRFLQTMPPRHR